MALAVAALALAGLAACGDDADIPDNSDIDASVPVSAATVRITGDGFAPDTVSVTAGDAVAFTNDDDQDHRVVAKDASFDTGVLHPGESTIVAFGSPARVEFSDTLDPAHTGQVEVGASTP